jgi:hypothetical protein
MISLEDARKKAKQLAHSIAVANLIDQVLERKLELTPANSDDSQDLKELTYFIENRLAQPHLGYLAPDQVNGVWGGSLTIALAELGKRHNIALDKAHPKIGSDFMRAILDGTLAKETPVPTANTYDWLEHQVKNAVYPAVNKTHAGRVWRTGKMEMNVVGIRGYMVPEGVTPNYGNLWNDTIFIAWIDTHGQKQCRAWAASTDPGRYYYHTKPINPQGTAHLVPGQYAYVKGWHQSPANVAFNQAGTKAGNVLCYRADAPTINLHDATRVTEDSPSSRYWINIHAGFQWSATQGVEWSSAGCQVIKAAGWTDWRWKTFRDTLLNNAGGFFWYTLLDSRNLKK